MEFIGFLCRALVVSLVVPPLIILSSFATLSILKDEQEGKWLQTMAVELWQAMRRGDVMPRVPGADVPDDYWGAGRRKLPDPDDNAGRRAPPPGVPPGPRP